MLALINLVLPPQREAKALCSAALLTSILIVKLAIRFCEQQLNGLHYFSDYCQYTHSRTLLWHRARHTLSASSAMSFKLASVPDRPDAAPCSEEGLVAAPAAAAAAAATVPVQPTVHIVATVGGEAFEFDVPADRTVEFVKAYLDNKHGLPFDKQTLRWNDRVLIDPMYNRPFVWQRVVPHSSIPGPLSISAS